MSKNDEGLSVVEGGALVVERVVPRRGTFTLVVPDSWTDLDDLNAQAPVTGKSNAERWARALEQELLAQLLAPEPEPEKPPAPTFEEFAVTFLDLCKANRLESNLENWMKKVVELAKVPWHGTHILRKTCGTRIADGGGGVAAVAAHLRHKDLQTASRYIDRPRREHPRALRSGELMEA